MRWRLSRRFDQEARKIADRHYSRVKVGSPDFVGNGRPLVLLAPYDGPAKALWVTLWQKVVRHTFTDAWMCTLFRNEGAGLSSELITEAVAATAAMWGTPPANGFATMVNAEKIKPTHKPGWCYRKAGWVEYGETGNGLVVLGLPVEKFPEPVLPHGASLDLFGERVGPVPTNARSNRVGRAALSTEGEK